MLECSNGNFYTGYTNDLDKRLFEHSNGTIKSKFTRSFKPVNLAQCWKIHDVKGAALRIESFIKKQKREVKEKFIANPLLLIGVLLDDEKYNVATMEVEPIEGYDVL